MSGIPWNPPPQPGIGQQFNTGRDPNMMGPDYFKDKDELTWADDAHQRYNAEHGIDTEFGGITGPLGPVPAGLAIQYQAVHDQAVWNARNRMGREALRMSQGSAGLLSSYRAGGASALQANSFGQMANIQLQRAQMMQPLDLLGDYRRDQMSRASGAGREESAWGAALQGVGALLSVAVPGVGTIAGAALAAGGGYLGATGASKQNAAMMRAGYAGGGAYGGGAGAQSGAFGAALQMARGIQQMGQQGGNPYGSYENIPGGPAGMPTQVGQGQMYNNWDTGRSPNQSQTGFIDDAPMQSQGAGPQAAGNKSMGQGGQQQAGAGGMGMPGVVGADGIFSPTAYAANGMATNPVAPLMQQQLNSQMAVKVTEDPTWSMLSMAWDRELALRTGRAA